MKPFRASFKLSFRGGIAPKESELIPLFHEWIRRSALPDLLIDVSDYSHVADGPDTMLVSHEAIYAVDRSAGEIGLLFQRRRPPTESDLDEVLALDLAALLRAGVELEKAPSLGGRFQFDSDRILFIANDRLAAANDRAGYEKFEPHVEKLARRLFEASKLASYEKDPRERLSIMVKGSGRASISELLDRTSSIHTRG